MKYIKKKFGDKDNTPISFWSTDDNITCEDGKTLRENLSNIDTQYKDIANEIGTETLNTTAQDLKGAINEVFQSASNGKLAIVTALTGKGINASNTDTFEQLANKIGTISGSGNTFNVTNNLTHATNSNTKSTIEEYNSYKATISAENNYKLDSITITMGGTDITSSCYSNGEIHIEDVTGHLIITVVAIENTTPTVTLNWDFANQTAGNGNGDIQLTINDDTLEGDYDIYYGDDNGKLSDYDKICTLSAVKDTTKSYNYFNDFQLIPKNATKLIAIKDNVSKGEFIIPNGKRFTSGSYGNKLYSFGAISDVHLSVETAESDFETALTYLNNNENVVFTCISGDITNGGTEDQLATFKNLVNTNSANTPVYATNGNHEKYNSSFSDELWNKYVNNTRDYVFTYEKDVFVFMGIQASGTAGDAYTSNQRTWFENIINKYSNNRIFLFTHCFINGTGNGNYNSLYPVNILTTTNTCGKWLLDILKSHTNVILITGHSHLKFITQELDSRITICNNVDSVTTGYMLHIPSITIPRDILNGTSISEYVYAQSEGVVIDVYEKGILYRGRNFLDEKFIPIGQFLLPIEQHDLPISTYVITNNLANAITNNSSASITEGGSYNATITANDGYSINSITVTMGGVDITSSAVSGNVISINSVTGDILITVSTISTSKPCTNIVLSFNSITFTDKTTQTLTATATPSDTTDEITWGVSPTGIVTVNNGVITPVSNGSCVVTVTCGSQSATCNVTVSGLEITVNDYSNVKISTSDGTEITGKDAIYYYASNYIPIESNASYTLSCMGVGNQYSGIKICEYTSDKTFIKAESNQFDLKETTTMSKEFTTSSTTGYIRIRLYMNMRVNDAEHVALVMNSVKINKK